MLLCVLQNLDIYIYIYITTFLNQFIVDIFGSFLHDLQWCNIIPRSVISHCCPEVEDVTICIELNHSNITIYNPTQTYIGLRWVQNESCSYYI